MLSIVIHSYEHSNPMNYDLTVFHSSMKCLWSRYLALFRYCPDVWIEYAEYESEWNWEDSVSILKEGFEVMNNSCLFGLACCDFYEKHGHLEEAERQYQLQLQKMQQEYAQWQAEFNAAYSGGGYGGGDNYN